VELSRLLTTHYSAEMQGAKKMYHPRFDFSKASLALATLALAGWAGTAQAQQVSPNAGELTFSGQDTITAIAGASDVTAVGYINSGAFFSPGTVYTSSLNVFRPGGADQTTAIYTFALQGAGTRTVTSGIVKSIYSGVFTVYQDSPTAITKSTGVDPAGPNTPGNYGSGYPGTGFTDGNVFLTGDFKISSTFDTTINPAQGSFGSAPGDVVFTGGSLYNDFLKPNNYLTGTLGGTIAPANGRIPGYSGSVDGQLNATLSIPRPVPEPSTPAILALGILGLGGLALKARKRTVHPTA
jgi:hypothetical protein